ncbi:MAG: Gfo/Idh/MocA family oxidoreductase [Elusimicrobia bacterium]|nr:Gfo/Idh/MocA family oxidoreductase [Elusimicrobiota bacterium]
MKAPLRGAIIGFGKVAQQAHVTAWREATWATIVAVVDPLAAHRARAAAVLPRIRCYEQVETLFARETLDFVDIATPPHLHGKLAIECASMGFHVLCEKPLTLLTEELDAIEEIVMAGRVAVVPVHNWRHAPPLRQALRVVRRTAFGKVQMVDWQVLRNEPARDAGGPERGWRLNPTLAGGGIVVDHGWHAFYLVRGLIGEEPQAVTAILQGRQFPATQLEDTAHCLIRFPNATASVFLTWAAKERRVRGTIVGQGGTLVLDEDHLTLYRQGKTLERWHFPEPLSAGSQHPAWFAGTLSEFHTAIQHPGARAAHLREARACLSLLTATYRGQRSKFTNVVFSRGIRGSRYRG